MRRLFLPFAALVVVLAVAIGATEGLPNVRAEDRSLTVEIEFGQEGAPDGAACGLDRRLVTDVHPGPSQVIVSAANGDIVGKVDLYNALSTDLPADEDRPGTVELGICVVRSTMDLPDSSFYTFTIRGEYEWTVSRGELEALNWVMPIWFSPGES